MKNEQKKQEEIKSEFFIYASMADIVTLDPLRDWYTKMLDGQIEDEEEVYAKWRDEYKEHLQNLKEKDDSDDDDDLMEEEQKRDRCKLGHQLKFINKQALFHIDEDQENAVVQVTNHKCDYGGCPKNQITDTRPEPEKIQLMTEKYYACVYLGCLFAVHYDCYGGVHQHSKHDEADDNQKALAFQAAEEQEVDDEDVATLYSYIDQDEDCD